MSANGMDEKMECVGGSRFVDLKPKNAETGFGWEAQLRPVAILARGLIPVKAGLESPALHNPEMEIG